MYTSVVISNNIIDQVFEYYLPKEWEDIAQIGSRVTVNFGQANRTVMGFIVEIYEESRHEGSTKDILDLLDYESFINEEQFKLANYIANNTVCPLARVLNLMIPKYLRLKTTKYLIINDYCELDATLAVLFKGKSVVKMTKDLEQYNRLIVKEIKKGNIIISYEAKPYGKIKTITKYYVNDQAMYQNIEILKNSKQQLLIKKLHEDEALTKNEIIDKYEISSYLLNKYIKLGFLLPIDVQISRVVKRDLIINDYQASLSDTVKNNLTQIINTKNIPILWRPNDDDELYSTIYGLINNNIDNNLNTIIIVPDILSSYKIASIIRKVLHIDVACLNSQLSDGEYLDYFNEIIKSNYGVIVTTTKASLLPFIKVGAIIMLDVEHDNYFNDQSPRYDLKKVMEYRQKNLNCPLVFESFTPNLTEYSKGLLGKYLIINNYSNQKVIPAKIISLCDELKLGNNGTITNELIKNIKINMFLKKITLLITNNKNYSSLIECRSCGTILKCPRCQLSLKYNQKNQMLLCPTCSYRTPYVDTCPTCNNKTLQFEGMGMEAIKEELENKILDVRVILIDQPNYDDFSDKMSLIEDQEVDVIIATDTYARSIDTNNINLVGYINIDFLSSSQRYDAIQKAYNALIYGYRHLEKKINEDEENHEETAKRAKMIIQTYQPEAVFLQNFITGDYEEFLKQEINSRKALRNEPFYQVNRILVKAPYEQMFIEANSIKKSMQELLGKAIYIIGPNYNKAEQAASLIIKHQKDDISEVYKIIYRRYQNSSVTVIIDKYPKYL